MKITEIVCQVLRIKNVLAKTASSQDSVLVQDAADVRRAKLLVADLRRWLAVEPTAGRDQSAVGVLQLGEARKLVSTIADRIEEYIDRCVVLRLVDH